MTLRHYAIFQAVARSGSFRRAAEGLYITQSAVSHAIRELEDRTGAPLFERLPRGVALTRTGRLLLEEVAPILQASDRLEARLDALADRAPLRVASSITIAAFLLPGALSRLAARYPELPVQVEVAPAAAAAQLLREGRAELTLLEGQAPEGPFARADIAQYDLAVVCAPGYPLPGRVLSPQQLCGQRLLLRERGSAIRDVLDSALYLAGCTARPLWCSVNSQALLAAAQAGLGVAVLPEAVAAEPLAAGRLIRLQAPELSLTTPMLALWRRETPLSEPLEALLAALRGQSGPGVQAGTTGAERPAVPRGQGGPQP